MAPVSLLLGQVSRIWRIALWTYGVFLLGLCLPVVAKIKWGIPAEEFMRDPVSLLGGPFYLGLFSNLGIILWSATAAVCFFTAALLRTSSNELFLHWVYAGALTALLLFDDFFLFHEVVFPEHLGLSERVLYAAYGLGLAGYLVFFRAVLLESDSLLLLAALGFFGVSLAIDRLDGVVELRGFYVMEDGAKLLGISSWCLYFVRTAASHLRRNGMPPIQ